MQKKFLHLWRRVLGLGTVALVLLLAAVGWCVESPVVINEIFVDGASNYPDWIELYNRGNKPISLKGGVLTDNLGELSWPIKDDFVLNPGGFKVFYCDGAGRYDHTAFGLDSISGEVGLFSPHGGLVDSVTYDGLPRFSSLGRWPDGTGDFFVHASPTRGSANTRSRKYAKSGRKTPVTFSKQSGKYDKLFDLTMSAPDGFQVRFTTDGSLPDAKSPIFTAPLRVDKTTVVRASAVSPEGKVFGVHTRSYILGEHTRLPVISVISDPKNLWDFEVGIYVEGNSENWRHNWRRPVHLDFLDDKDNWQADGRMRIFGGTSRARPQKSLAIYTTSDDQPYGIKHRLFPDNPRFLYAGIILRNGGDAWMRIGSRDAFAQALVRGRVACDTMDYRPVIAYLNGEYWGVYGLRELMIRKNLLARHDLPVQPIDLMDGGAEVASSKGPFAHVKVIPTQGDYRAALAGMNMDAFLDYLAVELYSGNPDWPDGNIKCWRPRSKALKWQWILFDLDRSFNGKRGESVDEDPFPILYARSGGRGLMFRELARNPRFVRDFCARLAVHILTTYDPARALAILDRMVAEVRPEVERHIARWRWSMNPQRLFMSMSRWEEYLDQLRDYCRKRPRAMLAILDSRFGVGKPVDTHVRIALQGKGRILAEGVPLEDGQLDGPVPVKLDITLTAEPAPQYSFKGWAGHPGTGPQIEVKSGQTFEDCAIFEPLDDQKEEQ
ncbi:MAG: hypothetical protein PWQ57_1931 [Desulfovibrionales bacterium]|nr:hypothetical protein [Desulfovibrionales bacterium]